MSKVKAVYNTISRLVDNYLDSPALVAGTNIAIAGLHVKSIHDNLKAGNKKTVIAVSISGARMALAGITDFGVALRRKAVAHERELHLTAQEAIEEVVKLPGGIHAEMQNRVHAKFLGYDVVVWDELTLCQGQLPSDSFLNMFVDLDVNTIVLSKAMLSLDDDLLKAAMAHEIGHIKLGHVDRLHESMEIEFEADRFAFEQGYDIVKALRVLRRNAVWSNIKYGTSLKIHTLTDRINAAKKLTRVQTYEHANQNMG